MNSARYSRALIALLFGLQILPATAGTASLLHLYPDSTTAANPLLPAVPPVPGGSAGLCMAVETRFAYDLAPLIAFPAGAGRLEVDLRDNARRAAKNVLTLIDGSRKLTLQFSSAADNRTPQLVLENLADNPKNTSPTTSLGQPWGDAWTHLAIEWTADGQLTCRVAGRPPVTISLAAGFSPKRLELETWHIDQLTLTGDATFRLDWETGYAATLDLNSASPPPSPSATPVVRLLGFDTYAINSAPAKRDSPTVQLLNPTDRERTVTFDFTLHGEVGPASTAPIQWTQTLTAPARSETLAPITLPAPLASDVYHLKIHTTGLASSAANPDTTTTTAELDTEKHFFHAARRTTEPAGTPKFGLHDADNRLFGSWPDALGLDFAHVYAHWGYTVGPAWVRDNNGDYGIDPDTPSAEWNWPPRVDWLLGQHLTTYVSLQSEPFLPWMRERAYPKQKFKKYVWGDRGGFPKLDRYRQFVRAFATRYQGRVHHYEVENEPNAGGDNGIPPADYALISRAVFEEVRAVDPAARVYGICGTGNFVPWMREVFAAGGADYMDAVAIHTYVTPQLPEAANLPQKLDEVRDIIAKSTRPNLSILNSETGTYVALRENVDRPIPPERLAQLIKDGFPSLTVPTGWPNHALTEREGALSIVRNATYNFLAGAERFTFFGWNLHWPAIDWATGGARHSGGGSDGFALISATKDGVRTPSQHTLAIGVLTAQLEGALHQRGRAIDNAGVLGGVFPKQNGGEVAVLWSGMGKRSILLETTSPGAELVTLFGQTSNLSGNTHAIELGDEPIYLHTARPGIRVMSSPVINLRQETREPGRTEISFTLVNRNRSGAGSGSTTKPWADRVEIPPQQGWRFEPATLAFNLAPGKRTQLAFTAIAPVASGATTNAGQRSFVIDAITRLSDGTRFTFPIVLEARPTARLSPLPASLSQTPTEASAAALAAWQPADGELRIDTPDQVAVGRPPKLTSIQEEQFWAGPAELSARVKLGYDRDGLLVYVDVTDANVRLPQRWPDVRGSVVELFFDFRPLEQTAGSPAYGKGVYQVVLRPALQSGDTVEIWNASKQNGILESTTAIGAPRTGGYWVAFRIPWASTGLPFDPATGAPTRGFGFDVAVDAPFPADAHASRADQRKSQIVLFGTASNNVSTSGFGFVVPR
ncbi:hypothetical protein [Geminisphaera colitermitum]|uniref:hypothetical protein n=1 Tax=Geminisphaera colitermitum TaxID=1148786 RepID=UPI00019652E1|nr:hypothetical protein [Geminisphaera colitermitum]